MNKSHVVAAVLILLLVIEIGFYFKTSWKRDEQDKMEKLLKDRQYSIAKTMEAQKKQEQSFLALRWGNGEKSSSNAIHVVVEDMMKTYGKDSMAQTQWSAFQAAAAEANRIYDENVWSYGGDASGAGSTWDASKATRDALWALFDLIEAETMLDFR